MRYTATVLCLGGFCATTAAQVRLATQTIQSGLVRPVFVCAPPADAGRLFVLEQRAPVSGQPASVQRGRIRIITLPGNTLLATPFWTSPNVTLGNEQGLLGLAFHPGYAQNGTFYVYYTRDPDGTLIVARGTRSPGDPNIANAAVATILAWPHPATNHNGGWIDFGPDGYLYVDIGDGGGQDDNQPPSGGTTGNAQDLTDNLLGKILRLDVDGANDIPGDADDDQFPADANKNFAIPPANPFVGVTGDDEVWAYGARNPWRSSFDLVNMEIAVADVGQNQVEEVTFLPLTNGPFNLGWRCWEGTRPTGFACGSNPDPIPPHFVYGHVVQWGPTPILGCSITGGYVYRGSAIPCLWGQYIFADYCSGDIYTFRRDSSGLPIDFRQRRTELDPAGAAAITNVTSFGQDASGELYICDQSGGEILKIVPNGFNGPDCNANGRPDDCDIYGGFSPDRNGDTVPDECGPPFCNDIDFNNDDVHPDTADLFAMLQVFSGGPCDYPSCDPIDFNNDQIYPDTPDLLAFLEVFSGGPCPF